MDELFIFGGFVLTVATASRIELKPNNREMKRKYRIVESKRIGYEPVYTVQSKATNLITGFFEGWVFEGLRHHSIEKATEYMEFLAKMDQGPKYKVVKTFTPK